MPTAMPCGMPADSGSQGRTPLKQQCLELHDAGCRSLIPAPKAGPHWSKEFHRTSPLGYR
jgi:hypothetical protein